MSFTDLQNKAIEFDNSKQILSLKGYEADALLYVDKLKEIENLKGKEFDYLLSDVICYDCKANYSTHLGQKNYMSSNQYAKNCIEIELKHIYLKPNQALNWTRNALHCFDHLIVHYINEVLKETVIQIGKWFKETFNYEHLILKGGDLADIGSNFKSIYQLRSEFEHIQYKDDATGKVVIRNLSNKHKRQKLDLIIKFFKTALEKLEFIYLNLTPSLK
jgi:hypothetical protein